jgi:hypothetical protein
MKIFADYHVPDLTRSNTEWTFILESPHHEEIKCRCPAAGESGEIMSEVILDCTEPFGKLIHQDNPIVKSYSVMNASRFPLQESCYEEAKLRKEISKISNARSTRQESIPAAKEAIKQALISPIGNQITNDLKRRIIQQLESNPDGRFVVCGVVAQSIFEAATNTAGWFHELKPLYFERKKAWVFYENHPSEKSGKEQSKWKDPKNIQHLLNLLH